MLVLCAAMSVTFVASGVTSPPAEAAFPGSNGRILVTLGTALEPTGMSDPYGSDFNLFSISPAGAGLQQVTQGPAADFEPASSPDGNLILFARAPYYGLNSDIYIIDEKSNETNLTNTPLEDEADPMWSPDGNKIVFSSTNKVDPPDLYLMDRDGSNRVRLAMPGDQNSPAWSPTGDWIAYRHSGAGSSQLQIRLIRPDGSRDRLLVDSARLRGKTPVEPNWSPNGKEIAFCAIYTNTATQGDLYLIDADGSGLRRLPDTGNENDPVWSPDGQEIAFVSNGAGTSGNAGSGEYSVYKMRADGSHVVRLLNLTLDPFQTDLDWGPRP